MKLKDYIEAELALGNNPEDLCRKFAARKTLSSEDFEYLSSLSYWEVKQALSKNPKAPSHIIKQLHIWAKDNEIHQAKATCIQVALVRNPNTSIEIIKELTQSPRRVVRRRALLNLWKRHLSSKDPLTNEGIKALISSLFKEINYYGI